jgi:formate C-acetyltransferase
LPIERDDVLLPGTYWYQKVQRLREQVLKAKLTVCVERALLVTEAYKETEDIPILLRRAQAYDKILRNMKVYILPDEVIVGHQAERQRSSPLFPDYAYQWVVDEIDQFSTRPYDRFEFAEEDKKVFLEQVVPYWKGASLSEYVDTHFTEDIRLQRFAGEVFNIGTHEENGFGHVMPDFARILTKGLIDVKHKAQDKLNSLNLWEQGAQKKREFWESALISADAVIAYANRYADEAGRLVALETDPVRRQELETIARVCRRVPEYPAENLQEALQSLWFMQLILQIVDNAVSISPGRIDQWLYPYYEDDILKRGKSREECQGILEAFWIKFCEPAKLYRASDAEIHSGFPMGQNVCVGGVTPDGIDGVNDLSYRFLECQKHIRFSQPNFSVRLHGDSPYEFVYKVCEIVSGGGGLPQIMNDDSYIPALMSLGVSLRDARDYAPEGCVEGTPLNCWGRGNGGFTNLPKILELALNNGVCRITSNQVGPKTGDPRNFKNFDELLDAYEAQVRHTARLSITWNNILDCCHEEKMPYPLMSLMLDDCVERGKDVTSGGAKYNWTGPVLTGPATLGNMLYAVKKVVFDDQKYTMGELIDALDNDFKGQELMRQYLINRVAKYGNDEDEVDHMTHYATSAWIEAISHYETYRGGPFTSSYAPVAGYVPLGHNTGATPDGRHAGDPLSDGVSPSMGTDTNGPTAAFRSVVKLDHYLYPNGLLYNFKLNTSTVRTQGGMKKFATLVKSYVDMKGMQIQINVVDRATLLAAQRQPEKYRDLVVRVAGYSAFFTELSEDVQNSIIARTEHTLAG